MNSTLPVIAVVAQQATDRGYYQHLLANDSAFITESYASLPELKMACYGKLYAGFIVDVRTLIRSDKKDKAFFAMLVNAFPIMRVTRNPRQNTFAGLVHGMDPNEKMEGPALLDHFITEICLKTPPRGIRADIRKTLYLSVLLTTSASEPATSPLPATLTSISEGGAFVISNLKVQRQQRLYLTITAMQDQTPIAADVKWCKPWGPDTRYLPGFGVAFIGIQTSQVRELMGLLG